MRDWSNVYAGGSLGRLIETSDSADLGSRDRRPSWATDGRINTADAPVERDERAAITMEQVLRAYDYAGSHPHQYLRGTTNWCAAVAHSLNEQARAALERKP